MLYAGFLSFVGRDWKHCDLEWRERCVLPIRRKSILNSMVGLCDDGDAGSNLYPEI